MYSPIKDAFYSKFRRIGYRNVHLEITSGGKFSPKLKKALGMSLNFMGRRFAPDLTGFLVEGNNVQPITIEVKRKRVGFKELFQAKGYGELLDAKHAFLISSEPLSVDMKEALRQKLNLMYFGYPNVRLMHVGRFNIKNRQIISEDWFPSSPF